MSLTLRIILIVCSIISFVLVIRKTKQSKLKIADAIIWIVGSLVLIIISIFSDVVGYVSSKMGFMAPVNFVFFAMIVFLLIQVFVDNIRISNLNEKIKNLNHYIALKEKQNKES